MYSSVHVPTAPVDRTGETALGLAFGERNLDVIKCLVTECGVPDNGELCCSNVYVHLLKAVTDRL